MLQQLRHGACIALLVHALSVSIACFEIEIEGTAGWAADLPTWRRKSVLCGSRPLTGYHIALAVTLILSVGAGSTISAVLYGGSRWWVLLALSLAAFCFTMLFEDMYWFVLNYRFREALKTGGASHHFQSRGEQLALYAICTAAGSTLWMLGYGTAFSWTTAAAALGFFGAASVVLFFILVAWVRPVYTATDSYLRGSRGRRVSREDVRAALLLLFTLVAFAIWALAFYTWTWQ